ncbi:MULTISPECIES: hypothetical protein [unclassified Streptomyces]|uniref:hypothetical protein n=1 Tax=unclassified Streptomyces TaxID=2593676 RepID=UPI00378F3058
MLSIRSIVTPHRGKPDKWPEAREYHHRHTNLTALRVEDHMTGNNPASVTDDYAQRVNADLAAVQSEQERVRAEITRLQGELGGLEKSEAVLTQMKEVLSGAPTASAGEVKNRAAAAVPAARSNRDASSGASGRAGRGGRGKKGGPKAGGGKRTSASGPTWAGRVSAYLDGQGEPKSAAEVAEALSQTLPDREAPSAIVRNALEQGVAQGRIERTKQGRSVYYTAVKTPAVPKDAQTASSS